MRLPTTLRTLVPLAAALALAAPGSALAQYDGESLGGARTTAAVHDEHFPPVTGGGAQHDEHFPPATASAAQHDEHFPPVGAASSPAAGADAGDAAVSWEAAAVAAAAAAGLAGAGALGVVAGRRRRDIAA